MKYYVSASNKEVKVRTKVVDKLRSQHIDVSCYEGGEYNRQPLEIANACIFILPGNSFEYPLERLTTGCLSELIYCLNTRKPIYIAYQILQGEYKIYAAEITDNLTIKGIANTSYNICELEKFESINKQSITNFTNFY